MLLYFTFLISSVIVNPIAHPFHLSKALVEFNEQERALQISMHLFIDDFEDGLKTEGNDNLYILTEKEAEHTDQAIYDYIQKHFLIEVNNQEVYYNYIGKELAEDVNGMWCYLEVENVSSIKDLKITNDILIGTFEDQKNVISIIGPNRKKGIFLLEKGSTTDSISY